jgi:hypothetical protein
VLKHIMLGFEESFNAYGIVRCTSRNSHFEIPSSLSVADWLSPSAIFVMDSGQGTPCPYICCSLRRADE